MCATDLGYIDRQSHRILRLLTRIDGTISPASLMAAMNADELQQLTVRRKDGSTAALLHMPAVVDSARMQEEIITRLASTSGPVENVLSEVAAVRTFDDALDQLQQGSVILFLGDRAWAAPISLRPGRAVEEPSTERAVFGPKDAFVESMGDNIGLIRSHLRDPNLHAERMTLGTKSPTSVTVLYVAGTVDGNMLDDVIERLSRYRPARVGFVSSLLRPLFGAVWSPFLPAEFTERPYRVADFLSRGRIAVLVDGSPYAMVVPVPFVELFLDEEEYLQASATRYFVRTIRVLAFVIALLGPGLYVAILTVNTTVMPGLLAIAVSSNRQSIAFPIIVEAILMLLVLDIMAEATTAMKGVLGPAISIVGSLIVGQAAVRANLASNLGVIMLSLTALATFMTPRYQLTYAVRVLKYAFLVLSGMFGIIGWSVGIIWLMIQLSERRELGVPYLSPFAPLLPKSWSTTTTLRTGDGTATPSYIRRPSPKPR